MVHAGQKDVRDLDPDPGPGLSSANVADITPILEPCPDGGQVIVTRFECGSLRKLLFLMVLHHRVKRDVRRQAKGFVAGRMIVDWRDRVLLSVTIWQDLRSLYSMGGVPRHVIAARVPRQLGVATVSGVFCFVGDWKRVLFRADTAPRSPLAPTVPETNREDNNNA